MMATVRIKGAGRSLASGPARAGVVLALWLVSSGLGTVALGRDVVLLKSSDLTPYNLAAAALLSHRADAVTLTLDADRRQYDLAVHAIWSEQPEVIVALGVKALDVASREFNNVPVVFGMVADVGDYGDRSDRIAGIELIPSPGQVLRAAHAVLPEMKCAAVIFDPERSTDAVDRFSEAGAALGIKVRPVPFTLESGFADRLRTAASSCECLVLYPDPILLSDKVFGDLVFRAFDLGLPTIAYSSTYARKGAMMSVEADYGSIGTDLGTMVDQVLAGASARALGVRAPSKVKVTVNKAVADRLGIKVNLQPGALPADVAPSVDIVADEPRLR